MFSREAGRLESGPGPARGERARCGPPTDRLPATYPSFAVPRQQTHEPAAFSKLVSSATSGAPVPLFSPG
jgi:hypothetical protein